MTGLGSTRPAIRSRARATSATVGTALVIVLLRAAPGGPRGQPLT
jgi:hypothetical protein